MIVAECDDSKLNAQADLFSFCRISLRPLPNLQRPTKSGTHAWVITAE